MISDLTPLVSTDGQDNCCSCCPLSLSLLYVLLLPVPPIASRVFVDIIAWLIDGFDSAFANKMCINEMIINPIKDIDKDAVHEEAGKRNRRRRCMSSWSVVRHHSGRRCCLEGSSKECSLSIG